MDGESADDVIANAAVGDETISRDQLVRWHREGLVDRPYVRHLGRGRGTETIYPPGTSARAVKVARLLRARRRVSDVGWLLWWDRVDVDEVVVRRHLDRVAEMWRKGWSLLYREDGQLTEAAERFLDVADRVRLPSRGLSQVRRRTGMDQFPDFMDAMLAVLHGESRMLDEEVDLVERGLGLDTATPSAAGTAGWYDGGIGESLSSVGELMQPDVLTNATDRPLDELAAARDELQRFMVVIESMLTVASALGGRRGFGAGALRMITEAVAGDPVGQALLLSIWLVMRESGLAENMDMLVGMAPQAEENVRMLQAIDTLRTELPEARAVLTPRRFARVLMDPECGADLIEDIRRLRSDHAADIDRILGDVSEAKGSG